MVRSIFCFSILILGSSFLSLAQHVKSASSVFDTNRNGSLISKTFSTDGEFESLNTLPDYSYAGYMGGGVAIPNVPVKKTISATSGDQTKRIQEAINEVSRLPLDQNGFRGRILLKKGRYEINGSLSLVTPGVVLSGEGQGEDGTLLVATAKKKQILIGIGTDKSTVTHLEKTKQAILDDFVPIGATIFKVKSTSDYKIGDTIFIEKTPNSNWIETIQMSRFNWKPKDFQIKHERIITNIGPDNSISVNIPLVDAIQNNYGGGVIYKAKINRMTKNCGVENLRLASQYASTSDENHGWEAVKIRMAEHCWVRKVTALYFGMTCVTILKNSVFNTVEDCAMLDPKSKITGGRRYSFNISHGSFNLIQRCYTRSGRHDFVTGARVAGPNVFLDCYAEDAKADTGPHQKWATGILFDNIHANSIRVVNGKSWGSGHGWTGAQIMLWNCVANKLYAEVPPTAMNWVVSTKVQSSRSSDSAPKTFLGRVFSELLGTNGGYSEAEGPRSLYLKQLEDRLGSNAVRAVTTADQRAGNLFEYLEKWKGG